MNKSPTVQFDQADMLTRLEALDTFELDALDFGVIDFDCSALVQRYDSQPANRCNAIWPPH